MKYYQNIHLYNYIVDGSTINFYFYSEELMCHETISKQLISMWDEIKEELIFDEDFDQNRLQLDNYKNGYLDTSYYLKKEIE